MKKNKEGITPKILAMIQFLRMGYNYQPLDTALIDSKTKIFTNRFKSAIEKINNRSFDNSEITTLINEIETLIKNKDLGQSFYTFLMSTQNKIKLIDFEDINKNDFAIANDFLFNSKDKRIFQQNIIILVNGIPLAFLEVNNINKPNKKQPKIDIIKEYIKNTEYHELFNMIQLIGFSENIKKEQEDKIFISQANSFYSTPNGNNTIFLLFKEEQFNLDIKNFDDISLEMIRYILKDNYYNLSNFEAKELQMNLDKSLFCNNFIISLFNKRSFLYYLKYNLTYTNNSIIQKRIIEDADIVKNQKVSAEFNKEEKEQDLNDKQNLNDKNKLFSIGKRRKIYMSIKKKFIFTAILLIMWLIFATYLGYFWYLSLIEALPQWLSLFILISLAILPAINTIMLICGCMFDKQRDYKHTYMTLPDITILIAAYNEENGIYDTLKYLSLQEYPGKMYIKVVDNNSKDKTKEKVFEGIRDFKNIDIEYMFQEKQGKYAALNLGLESTTTPYVITLDADTILYKNALATITNHIVSEKKNVGAVAGSVLVRNSRTNILTKLQEWEYFLSISGIKRSQGLFASTLVAQGAFSIYVTDLLKELGGWEDTIGEDIVLTWDILAKDYITQFEPEAIGFTNVPTNYKIFFRQRARWARGMIEGLKRRNFWKYPNHYTKFHIFQDLLLPIIDYGVVAIWIPGLMLAIFKHNFLIVGPRTLLMLPITIIMITILFYKEKNKVFKDLNLKVRRHYGSFILFIFVWNLLVAPAALTGYWQELKQAKRRWR